MTIATRYAWMDRAKCTAVGAKAWESWMPEHRRKVCRGCPVRAQCRQLLGTDHPLSTGKSAPS